MKVDTKTMDVVREIARRVSAVKIPVGAMKSHQRLHGDRRSIHRGEGDDFDGHELYMPGDDPRTIDWNATAMTGGQQILVALYKEEMHIRSTILCDVSPTMTYGSQRVSKQVLAAELAACAVKSLAVTHDPVGLVTYSHSGIERRVKSGSPTGMMLPVIAHILQSRHVKRPGQHSGLAKALTLVPRSPSIVFLLSDFLSVRESDWTALKRVGRRHRLFSFYVQDKRERQLPDVGWLPALYTFMDCEGREKDVWVTRASARQHKADFEAREATILQRLQDCRASTLTVCNDEGAAATARILNFLQARVR